MCFFAATEVEPGTPVGASKGPTLIGVRLELANFGTSTDGARDVLIPPRRVEVMGPVFQCIVDCGPNACTGIDLSAFLSTK